MPRLVRAQRASESSLPWWSSCDDDQSNKNVVTDVDYGGSQMDAIQVSSISNRDTRRSSGGSIDRCETD